MTGTSELEPQSNLRERAAELSSLLLFVYVLSMGQRIAWSEQNLNRHFFLGPWWTNTSVKYALLVLLAAAGILIAERLSKRFAPKWTPRLIPLGLGALMLAGQAWVVSAAWGVLRGEIPWGYDHSSFMFRLHEFGEVFPRALGGYSAWWNAGIEHFTGVTSGAQGYGILNLPLLWFREPHAFYGGALVFWFVLVFPWLGVASLLAAKLGPAAAFCGGMILLCSSRGFVIWMWHFGTVGAMTSAVMILPVAALAHRLLVSREGGWGTVVALALATWLMCLWTPGVFVAAGLGLGWLWLAPTWTLRSNLRLFAAGALALLLLSPWFWHVLFPCRNVVEYVGTAREAPDTASQLIRGWNRLVTTLGEWHPLALIPGLLGAVFFLPRETRRLTLPPLLILAAITGWWIEWKPLSQLERMAIPMSVVAIFPAAAVCAILFQAPRAPESASTEGASRRFKLGFGLARALARPLAQGVVVATLVFGLRVARMHYANEGVAPLRVMPEEVGVFADWVRKEVPPEGRLAFAGPAVHAWGGGKIAYLPVLAGREMMADDYYGFPPQTIEFHFPPAAYRRRGLSGYLFFSNAYGITHWTSTHPDSIAFFEAHPEAFERLRDMELLGREIILYRVLAPVEASRFYEGAGQVDARPNRLRVTLADPEAEQVVLRYNWRQGLYSRTRGATIQPWNVDENLQFIAVEPGGNAEVVIGYRPHWTPVEPNFDGHFHH